MSICSTLTEDRLFFYSNLWILLFMEVMRVEILFLCRLRELLRVVMDLDEERALLASVSDPDDCLFLYGLR